MEGRKTEHGILKEVFQYIFFAIFIALAVVAYVFRENIANFFANDLTNVELINVVLHWVPNILITFEIVMLAVVVNFVIKILAKFCFGLTDKGKTLANIFASLLKWVVIIAALLWILSSWGVNTTTLLASAGILALVVGLGAQSLIADILAGIFIVIEGEYVVGDIVVIDGWRGKIVNIGIRTTQLEDIGGDIKIVNNSEIKSVINQTKHQSVANCSVSIASNENLEKVESIIKQAFPEIRHNIPAITHDIIYKGVTSINEIRVELLFGAPCFEEDLYQVQRDFNRELKILLDKNGISSFATPAITVEDPKKSKTK